MLCFQDMTFCKCSKCTKWDTCHRALTKEVTDAADRWWKDCEGSPPICMFTDTPECYKEREKRGNKELSTENGVK